jgi:hypothetical protein
MRGTSTQSDSVVAQALSSPSNFFSSGLRQKVDQLMNILWAGGVNNPMDSTEQISYLLFLRLLTEKDEVLASLDKRYKRIFSGRWARFGWGNFVTLTGDNLFNAVRDAIEKVHELPGLSDTGTLLFSRATLKIYDRPTLRAVVQAIHQLDLAAHDSHDFKGDMYEYLLSKLSASGTNGQFRTPRHIIDMIVALVADRRTTDLIPALFNDIFGNIGRIGIGFTMRPFAEVCESIFKGAFDLKQAEYRKKGIPFIRISNVQRGTIDISGAVFIDEKIHQRYRNCQLVPGDLVFCKVGTIDRIGKIPDTIVVCVISQNNVGVRLKRESVNPDYALAYLTSDYALSIIRAGSKKALQDKLILSELRRLPFLLPPMSLQEKFAQRVREIHELESQQAASHCRIEGLFRSLLHRAFEGEL